MDALFPHPWVHQWRCDRRICMNYSRGDSKRALIGSNARNPYCLGEYTNPFERGNVGTLCESTQKPNGLLTNVVVKRVLGATHSVFIYDDRTQLMPAQSGINIEEISSPTYMISIAPAADALAQLLLSSAVFILLRSWHCSTRSYGVLVVPFDIALKELFSTVYDLYA
ncbi:uncharacterized protein TNCV_4175811 [Trichonephila clavipes]|nr:uncharacterized protein TNCV_4175811 [Trichonephila clavipes]